MYQNKVVGKQDGKDTGAGNTVVQPSLNILQSGLLSPGQEALHPGVEAVAPGKSGLLHLLQNYILSHPNLTPTKGF